MLAAMTRYFYPPPTKRTTLLTLFFASVLVGLGLARIVPAWDSWVYVCVALVLAMCATMRTRRKVLGVVLCVLGLCVGCWRGNVYMHKLSAYDRLYGQIVTLQVIAQSDGVYDNAQISFDADSLEVLTPTPQRLPGKLTVKGRGASAVFRGDVLRITGKLYKTRGSSQAGVSFASIALTTRHLTAFDKLRLKFSAGIRNALPEPQASFGIGILIGQKTSLPDQVSDDLSTVGLTHIIAVSGYNLTVIIEITRRKLGKRSKYQATIWSLALISSFLLVTGFGASIVRAAIVSIIGLWAWYYGRKVRPVLLILCAAALTAGWYPLYLWSDIGWYLSFLAFFGVLVIAPFIVKRLEQIGRQPNIVTLLVIESFCAQLMTLPIIMYIFHRLSVIGLLSNVLVVPLVPLGMLTTLLAGIAGAVSPALSGWVGTPARLILTYMLDLAHTLAGWPHALIEQPVSLEVMIILYLGIDLATFILWRTITKNDTITDKK